MYNYNEQKNSIFTDDGQREFIKVKDHVDKMLNESGAFKMSYAWEPISGDTWLMMAYVDRLVELGYIKEVKYQCSGQDRVFISA